MDAKSSRSSPGPFSCVIFDLDGTLTRTNELIFASFNHVARKYLGKELLPREVIALFGPPEEGGLARLIGSDAVDTAMNDLCDFYHHHHASMARAHSGVEEMLGFLKERDVQLALFTGKGRRTTSITLDTLDLGKYFDLTISGTDVVHHKPHPEGIRRVLDAFALQPHQALMVGDGLADIKASRAAGVPVAAALWDCYDTENVLAARSEYVFWEVSELLAWFRHQYS